jgi:hypothetical protein
MLVILAINEESGSFQSNNAASNVFRNMRKIFKTKASVPKSGKSFFDNICI